MEKLKKCTTCKVPQSLDNFTKDNSRKDKLKASCKLCCGKHTKNWCNKHKEQSQRIARISYYKRKPKILARRKLLRALPENKKKAQKYNQSWNKRNPLRAKLTSWKRAGIIITIEEYEQRLQEQNNVCAICKTPTTKLTRLLDVDHCHETGKVRGLLCMHCNRGLGLFRDSQESLLEAVNYLKQI